MRQNHHIHQNGENNDNCGSRQNNGQNFFCFLERLFSFLFGLLLFLFCFFLLLFLIIFFCFGEFFAEASERFDKGFFFFRKINSGQTRSSEYSLYVLATVVDFLQKLRVLLYIRFGSFCFQRFIFLQKRLIRAPLPEFVRFGIADKLRKNRFIRDSLPHAVREVCRYAPAFRLVLPVCPVRKNDRLTDDRKRTSRRVGQHDWLLAAEIRIVGDRQIKILIFLRLRHLFAGNGKGNDLHLDRFYGVIRQIFQLQLRQNPAGLVIFEQSAGRNQNRSGNADDESKISGGTGLRGLCTMRPVAGEIIRPVLCLSRGKIARYLEQESIPHIQDSTNLSDEYTRNRIRHHILPMLEQEINAKAVAHMSETAERISQAEEYLTCQSLQILEEFHTDTGYYFTEKFFMQPQIIQTYALQLAMENLAGRRKDISAVHYEKVLALYEMQTGRKISLPYCMEARKDYDGVKLYLLNKEERRKRKTEEWELIVPGKAICPLGTFSAEIFLYEGQKIEEKKYTKWLDYDKIKKNPCIRTRRTGDYMIINAQGNTKKLNRCMIDAKIPADQREKIPLVVCEDEVLWMVGSRMNEWYKINPQTRKVLVLNYQGGYQNE